MDIELSPRGTPMDGFSCMPMSSPLPDHPRNPSSSLSQMSLSSLSQLQTSTLFHLSIISMIGLHSTGSYLETL
jgi:hypothetical protein